MPLSPGTSRSAGSIVDELTTSEGSGQATSVVSDRYTRVSYESPSAILSRRTIDGSSGSGLNASYNQSSEVASRFSSYLGFDNQYDFNYRVFPDDLGADNLAHYMIININVQVGKDGLPRTGVAIPSQFGPANYQITNELSKVDQLKFGNASNVPGLTSFEGLGNLANQVLDGQGFNVPRYTRRIKESIALFMPVPMAYTHTNVYEEISLTSFGAQAAKLGVTAAGKALTALLTGRINSAINSGLPRAVASGAFGETARQIAGIAGYPINPKVEVIFSHTPQRAFRMELLMAPKNSQESETVKNIVDTLRFHAAPEISSIGGVIPTFVAPAEFDITFYHKGKENTKIPRINTCALEQVEIDYAPAGIYATFSNGHPVTMRLSLAFRELEILHKQRVTQGF
jgi:hypothetical protein